jgi:LCP family protein required for cell wall assembly
VVVDGLVVVNRIRHVDIALPITRSGAGTNYVLLGLDSRADLPAGVTSRIGTATQVPGARADVVLVVHVAPDGTAATVAIPRDMLVRDGAGYPMRLTMTFLEGPQATVDALCRSLGIATTHLVIIDFAGFADVVDALGGITVDLPHPVRDQVSGLEVRTAGAVRLDGLQALALVRSRHAEQWVGGAWVAMDDTAGAAARTRWTGLVFQTLQQGAARAKSDPVLLQRLAWTLSGTLTTDSGTGPFDLLGLARAAGTPVDLPGDPIGGSALGVQVTAATRAAVAAAGIGGGCTPQG